MVVIPEEVARAIPEGGAAGPMVAIPGGVTWRFVSLRGGASWPMELRSYGPRVPGGARERCVELKVPCAPK